MAASSTSASKKRGVYTDAAAAHAARQMLRAVGYLHAHHIVHRDLKLENFLYEGGEEKESQLKLIDFGFAKIWDPSTLMMASCGSIAYVSPDVLCGKGYTNKCDLWSLGVIVWMLLAGYPPFHGDEKQMMAKIKAGQADWSHKSRWKPVTQNAIDLLKKLLNRDPQCRPDAQQALRHPWLARQNGEGASACLGRDALRSLQRYAKASKVRRAVLQLLAQELAPDETHELREGMGVPRDVPRHRPEQRGHHLPPRFEGCDPRQSSLPKPIPAPQGKHGGCQRHSHTVFGAQFIDGDITAA